MFLEVGAFSGGILLGFSVLAAVGLFPFYLK